MNPAAYLEMADTEMSHWWFLARRAILEDVIQRLELPTDAEILEIGCGTGGNLGMLSRFGQVSGLEMDSAARDIALGKAALTGEIKPGKCPDDIPFPTQRFDLVCLFDVLEHIDEDRQTLCAVKQLVKPGGVVLITVPAYQWLWSQHDTFLHHKRRYTLPGLAEKAVAAGMRTEKLSYFNTFLFPLAVAARIKDKLVPGGKGSGTSVPPAMVNALFRKVFAFERHILKRGALPFGISILGVFRVKEPLND